MLWYVHMCTVWETIIYFENLGEKEQKLTDYFCYILDKFSLMTFTWTPDDNTYIQ